MMNAYKLYHLAYNYTIIYIVDKKFSI